MPQVSKRMIAKDVEKRIESLFTKAFSNCRSTKETTQLLEDILTPTEKVMLAKRMCIAFLLIKGRSYDYISNVLKVSRTTVGSVALQLKERGDGYRRILKKIAKREKLSEFFDRLDEIFENIFLPPRSPAHGRLRTKRRIEKLLNQPPF